MTAGAVAAERAAAMYRMIWRWHFYAGLFCIPFVLWLAVTGSIYLFKPQIEALIDRPYDTLTIGTATSPSTQVNAALSVLPGAQFKSYELPATDHAASRVLVDLNGVATRVYIHPATLRVLKVVPEDDRFMNIIFNLHGEMLLGDRGSIIIELAASWAIVMIVTGLYLWWPRRVSGFGGVLYPRLSGQGRTFWRDLHAVTGLWVSFFTLFILLSGLPWAKSWGAYLQEIRQITGTAVVKQDWPSGSPAAMPAMPGMSMPGMAMPGATPQVGEPPPFDLADLDRVVTTVAPLHLADPVLVSPPGTVNGDWAAKSDAQDRISRTDLTVDGQSGAVTSRVDFGQRQLVDRIVGVGVAAHEGHLFGWLNQLVSFLTAIGLIAVCISAFVMWRRRRSRGVLGAPQAMPSSRVSTGVIFVLMAFGLLLPLLGLSMVVLIAVERLILRRIPGTRDWLGLRPLSGRALP